MQTISFSASDIEQPPAPGGSMKPMTFSAADIQAPDFSTSNQKDAGGAATVDPNTVGTLISHFATQVNPIGAVQTIGKALMPEWSARLINKADQAIFGSTPLSDAAASTYGPLNFASHLGAAHGAVFDEAKAAYAKGDYLTAARKFVNYLIPLAGPGIDKSSDLFQAGKWAAGGGDALGIGFAVFGPKKLPDVVRAAAASEPGQALAKAAEAAAESRVVDVIAPKVGANKIRFGNAAADVAPAVARQTTGLSRGAVAESVAAKLEDATAALDEATNTRLNAKASLTKPVLDALQKMRDRLTSQAVQGSQFTPQSGVNRPPLGADVVPAPNAARVAQIDQAINEVKTLGPVARYEALRRIREAYDGPARAVYHPSMTADFLTAQGGKLGAADVTSALRDHLATLDPRTAAANAEYSLWKKASDVLAAAEETERVRPTVGRTLMARGLGAAAGGGIDGGLGAAVGAMVGPLIERAMTGVSPAIKLLVARQLATMADALRAGDTGKFKAVLSTVQKMVPAAAVNAARAVGVQPQAIPAAAGTEPQR
jgi:hypothetical protein